MIDRQAGDGEDLCASQVCVLCTDCNVRRNALTLLAQTYTGIVGDFEADLTPGTFHVAFVGVVLL